MLPKNVFPLFASLLLSFFLLTGCDVYEIKLTETALPIYFERAGDQITFTYAVSNVGEVILQYIKVENVINGRFFAPLSTSCPETTLNPHHSMTCTAVYTITEADVTNGKVNFHTRAFGYYRGGCGIRETVSEAYSSVSLDRPSALSLTKISNLPRYTNVGQQITYTYTITNLGNMTVTDPITIQDDQTLVTCPSLPSGGLAPDASLTCTATRQVTADDMRNGAIKNTAVARAGQVESAPVSLSIPVDAHPTLTLAKAAQPSSYSDAGTTITYTLLITNSGNVPLSGPLVINDSISSTWQCSVPDVVELAPGETVTCTSQITITENDSGATFQNSATVSMNHEEAVITSNEATAKVFFIAPPPIELPTLSPTLTVAQYCSQFTEESTCPLSTCSWSTLINYPPGACIPNP